MALTYCGSTAFRRELEKHRLTVTQRMERGQDIEAACGQLAVKGATNVQRQTPDPEGPKDD